MVSVVSAATELLHAAHNGDYQYVGRNWVIQ
jgi:hypothetical protein